MPTHDPLASCSGRASESKPETFPCPGRTVSVTRNDQSNVDQLDEDDHLLGDPNDDVSEANAPVNDVYEDKYDKPEDDEKSDSWWDVGLITLLLVAGVILFVFPEPVTSGLGILLILTGAALWLVDLVV